ncbi:hypothetical protein Acr_11g0001510 [Actinidia rufa]|uniref:Uncharacterized protein n=1 Tax=Actinidia rufa TaxID=165716 RepID=A0A7J0FB07_9ERIC|nr:hypothetical protein Acr_11g0001510 [Actinidia rufa]
MVMTRVPDTPCRLRCTNCTMQAQNRSRWGYLYNLILSGDVVRFPALVILFLCASLSKGGQGEGTSTSGMLAPCLSPAYSQAGNGVLKAFVEVEKMKSWQAKEPWNLGEEGMHQTWCA